MQILSTLWIAPESMRSERWDVDLLTRLQLALFSIDQIAQRAFLNIKRLCLVQMDVVRRRSGRLASDTRMRIPRSEDLTRREGFLVRRDIVRLERSVEKVPRAVRADLGSYHCHLASVPKEICSCFAWWFDSAPKASREKVSRKRELVQPVLESMA